MTENESAMAFALKMYGEKLLAYVQASNGEARDRFDDMCFWQDQLMHCANAVAAERV